jgi:hypothetical protein
MAKKGNWQTMQISFDCLWQCMLARTFEKLLLCKSEANSCKSKAVGVLLLNRAGLIPQSYQMLAGMLMLTCAQCACRFLYGY